MTDENSVFNMDTFLSNLPKLPGIYQMFSSSKELLYVGKARNLQHRVSSYFRSSQPSPKVKHLVKQIDHVEITVTPSENDALLLESNLIKQLKPRYNVLLRDDKSYPYIYLSSATDFPRLVLYRGAKKAKGRYFGPYPNTSAVRQTVQLLQKVFRLRQCDESYFSHRARPCLQYQIKRCTAPCVGLISQADYQKDVRHAMMFLEGKNTKLLDELIKQMEQAAADLEYEQAASLRDRIAQLRQVQSAQYASYGNSDIDVIAAVIKSGSTCVSVLTVRAGRVLGSKAYFPKTPKQTDENEILSAFLAQYYFVSRCHRTIPPQIITSAELTDQQWLQEAMTEQSGYKVNVTHRVRSVRAQWLQMALTNSQQALLSHLSSKASIYHRLEDLQAKLQLDEMPTRIECFDISHTMGEATVASCVVFDINGPLKSDYRRFNIRDITPGDDYAAMSQALLRRYTKLKTGEGKLPDILLVDGGKGQLHQAEKIFEDLQIVDVILLAVAKGPGRKAGLETIWRAGSSQAIQVAGDSLVMHLILQIRDEAHRFAITGHRQRRDKKRKSSKLEGIDGIGAKRRRDILKYFGGLHEVTRASVENLAKVPGISKALAEKIYNALHE